MTAPSRCKTPTRRGSENHAAAAGAQRAAELQREGGVVKLEPIPPSAHQRILQTELGHGFDNAGEGAGHADEAEIGWQQQAGQHERADEA
jgi:hypothetical protein